ncbi:MAG: Phytoene desaturase [Bacillota bacterium]
MKKSISIIGAGTAGLASAIRLQSQGYHVTIYEKNPQVGGRMYAFKEKGFQFDVGPTIVMMPEIYREVFEYSGANPDDYISMQLLDPLYQLHYQDGTAFTVSSNLTRLIPALEKVSLEDTQGYLAYLADIYARYNVARKGFIDRSFLSTKDILNWQNILNTLKLRTFNSAYQSIAKFVKNEKLRQALSFQTLYIGVSPFVGPSIYTIIPMIELLYGIWYIKGGMYAMAKAMQRRFEELGGKVVTNANVTSIHIQDHQAKGIIVNDTLIPSDAVLVNADFPYAVSHLIAPQYRGKYQAKKLKKMEYSSSSFIMYFGLNKKINTTVHQIRYAKDFKKNITDLFEPTLPEDPSFYIYSPTQIDQTLAPMGKEIIYVLVPVPNRENDQFTWDEPMKKTFRDKMVAKIKTIPGFEAFEKSIEVEKIMTPKDWELQFNLQNAATFGFKPILFQSNFFRPQVKALKVKQLYFAGTSTHPGAGIPIVMKAAKIAVDTILKEI